MLTSSVFLEFCLEGRGEGGCLLKLGAGVSVRNAIFPGIPSGGEGGCLQVGTGVSVGKAIFPGIPSGGGGGAGTD